MKGVLIVKKYYTKKVNEFPDLIEEGVIYYNNKKLRSVHLCPCDCGEEVWLSHFAFGWRIHFSNNDEVSITTPIANKKCDSLYTIRQGYSFDGRDY